MPINNNRMENALIMPLVRVCHLLNQHGVQVPYLSLRDLIASKETYRDQDRADLARLRRLLENNPGP